MGAASEVKKLIRELKGQPSWRWADLEKRLVGVVRACQREAVETCLDIETKWLDKDGMLIVIDGKDFLGDVRSAVGEVIGIGECSSSKT